MSSIGGSPPVPKTQVFSANLSQVAGTYDLCTASNDLIIKSVSSFVSTAALGLVSVAISSDNTTADAILAAVLLAALTGGKNLTPFTTLTFLPSGKKLQYTIVGIGSAGLLKCAIEWMPLPGDLV